MDKWIIITGGCGFIGSHLCKFLLKQNENILCIDNLQTGFISNIEYHLDNPKFKFIEIDIQSNEFQLLKLPKIKQIYHLACAASPEKYQKEAIHTIKTCVIGTLNMLEIATKNDCPILLSSTSEIYGDPLISPQNEDYKGNVNSFGPRACYDEGKRIAETLFYEYKTKYNCKIRVARIFNTYGPNMDINDGRVITNFIKQAKNNLDITIYGDGSQTRSFCYIDDQINGLVSLMNSNINKPINIGNPNEYTILEVAHIIIKLTNSSSIITFHNLPQDDPKIRCPDISRAKMLLGWNPTIELLEGLSTML